MALEVPQDVPSNPFVRAGLMTLDGDVFGQTRKVGTNTLLREFEYVQRNVVKGDLRTQYEWQQVRNACLLWCFSHRTQQDDQALTTLLRHVGLNLNVKDDNPAKVFGVIEARHKQIPPEPTSPADWIKRRPPPQRLPGPSNPLPLFQDSQEPQPLPLVTPYIISQPYLQSNIQSQNSTPRTSIDLNTNPKFHNKYTFTEHKQEYEGYQFQCIFRCLKDGKHCRKAPVREMNRHLRDRHHFRQGFKIAGVDWEKKRWRGAGADHEECVGKLVAKDEADEMDEEDENLGYVI